MNERKRASEQSKKEVKMNVKGANGPYDPLDSMAKEKYIKKAIDAIAGRIAIPDEENADIRVAGDIVIVTFLMHRPGENVRPMPGPTFAARVKIEQKTGRVIEVLTDAQ